MMKLQRIATQFIAALGDPESNTGNGAQAWGLWSVDPGPRGVPLSRYEQLRAAGGRTPSGWHFDDADWWLEEHGLLMEPPKFPVPPGKYLVTGDREVTTALTIYPVDANGDMPWALADDARLLDVTHLPCRAARYTRTSAGPAGSLANLHRTAFPVAPGAPMPAIEGCAKQDYAVVFVIGLYS
jgi:hypothetical protein